MMVGSIFDALGVPFEYCLTFFTHIFAAIGPLNTIGAFGLAVIVTTIIIRGALFPIFGWQLRTSRRIQAEQRQIAPELAELRKRYKKEPQKLSAEMQKLYAEHQVSPFSSLSGCLPALVQMPVLVGLYRGISAATINLHSGLGFLWIGDIARSGSAACCATTARVAGKTVTTTNWSLILTHPEVMILPLLAAILTFAQSRMMMPPARADMSDQERTMANVTKQMSVIFPVVIFWLSLNFPQGLALYWVTGTLFMVLQQFHLVGWGSLAVPAWFPGAGRVTPLSPQSAPPSRRPARTVVVPEGNGERGPRGRTTELPAATPVTAGAVNAPPSRPPKRRSNKRRR